MSDAEVVVEKKGRGRPKAAAVDTSKKRTHDASPAKKAADKSPAKEAKEENGEASPPKRSRGRPAKGAKAPAKAKPVSSGGGKGRGRPKKKAVESAEEVSEGNESES